MIIIGIDPGFINTGFGIIEEKNNKYKYLNSGVIKTKTKDVALKLKNINYSLNEIIDIYKPEEAAIEQIFVFQNYKSALTLGQARGVAICCIANKNIKIKDYSAKQVKLSVVGYGNASKYQVQHMIKYLLNLQEIPEQDSADALAIALCHIHTKNIINKIPIAQKSVRKRLK